MVLPDLAEAKEDNLAFARHPTTQVSFAEWSPPIVRPMEGVTIYRRTASAKRSVTKTKLRSANAWAVPPRSAYQSRHQLQIDRGRLRMIN